MVAADDHGEVTFQVCDVPASEAEKYAEELKQDLLGSYRDVNDVKSCSLDANAQDGGALLVLVLGTPFAIAIGKGIAKALETFFARRPQATVIVTKPGGTKIRVVAASADMAAIVRGLGG
jgi:hypothetical protein